MNNFIKDAIFPCTLLSFLINFLLHINHYCSIKFKLGEQGGQVPRVSFFMPRDAKNKNSLCFMRWGNIMYINRLTSSEQRTPGRLTKKLHVHLKTVGKVYLYWHPRAIGKIPIVHRLWYLLKTLIVNPFVGDKPNTGYSSSSRTPNFGTSYRTIKYPSSFIREGNVLEPLFIRGVAISFSTEKKTKFSCPFLHSFFDKFRRVNSSARHITIHCFSMAVKLPFLSSLQPCNRAKTVKIMESNISLYNFDPLIGRLFKLLTFCGVHSHVQNIGFK